MTIYALKTCYDDGTPCDGKLSRTVWSEGKLGDYFKELPIAMCDTFPTEKVGRETKNISRIERSLKNIIVS